METVSYILLILDIFMLQLSVTYHFPVLGLLSGRVFILKRHLLYTVKKVLLLLKFQSNTVI